jgi:hypothetical protein
MIFLFSRYFLLLHMQFLFPVPQSLVLTFMSMLHSVVHDLNAIHIVNFFLSILRSFSDIPRKYGTILLPFIVFSLVQFCFLLLLTAGFMNVSGYQFPINMVTKTDAFLKQFLRTRLLLFVSNFIIHCLILSR